MDKLWVYGCSFSEPFGLTTSNNLVKTHEYGTINLLGVDYWGTYLANKLNKKCITRSTSGVGWNHINNRIDEDILKWGKNDIIIISPSFLSRVTIMEFKNLDFDEKLIQYYLEWDDIIEYNDLRWRTKIKTLQHFGFNVFTWLVDELSKDTSEVDNLILAEGKYKNWKDWMDLHKEYWIDPTTNEYSLGDWHFNEKGHVAVSEEMFNFISNKIINY